MPLHFDFTNIKDYENKCYGKDGKINPLTDMLVWLTMSCDLGEITDGNYKDFYARVDVMQKLCGAFLSNADGTDFVISEEEVKDHIGLTTNVMNKSFDFFMSKVSTLMKEKYRLGQTGVAPQLEYAGLILQRLASDLNFGAGEEILDQPDFKDVWEDACDDAGFPNLFKGESPIDELSEAMRYFGELISHVGEEMRSCEFENSMKVAAK